MTAGFAVCNGCRTDFFQDRISIDVNHREAYFIGVAPDLTQIWVPILRSYFCANP